MSCLIALSLRGLPISTVERVTKSNWGENSVGQLAIHASGKATLSGINRAVGMKGFRPYI